MSAPVDVALDLPRVRQLSVGMRAYAEELARRLPGVAPDLRFETVVRRSALDFAEQVDLVLRLRRLHPRLVHHLSVYAPLAGPRPYVITIHDLIHLRFPEHFKRRVGPYYRTAVRWVAANAARIITDDERTIEDLERFLGVDPRKVRVVPLGVASAYLESACDAPNQTEGIGAPYFVYAGNRRKHKNLQVLFAAWTAIDPNVYVDLVLTGSDDGDLGGAMRPRRPRGALRFAGSLDDLELARLLQSAVALVYPSLCEGFGLPMLEAAALGTPVIASDAAVPSVLRSYVATFPPQDAEALTVLLSNALQERVAGAGKYRARIAEARRLARTLTWDRCAEATAEIYREVLAKKRRYDCVV